MSGQYDSKKDRFVAEQYVKFTMLMLLLLKKVMPIDKFENFITSNILSDIPESLFKHVKDFKQ